MRVVALLVLLLPGAVLAQISPKCSTIPCFKPPFNVLGLSLTPRPVDDKLYDIVHIKDFGCKNDGVTNCANALLRCAQTPSVSLGFNGFAGGAVCVLPGGGIYLGNTGVNIMQGLSGHAIGPRIQGTASQADSAGTELIYTGTGTALSANPGTCSAKDAPLNLSISNITIAFQKAAPNGIGFDACGMNQSSLNFVNVQGACANDGTFAGIGLGTGLRAGGWSGNWLNNLFVIGCFNPTGQIQHWVRDAFLFTTLSSQSNGNGGGSTSSNYFRGMGAFMAHNAIHFTACNQFGATACDGSGMHTVETVVLADVGLDSVNLSVNVDNTTGSMLAKNIVVRNSHETHETPHTDNALINFDLTGANPTSADLLFEESLANVNVNGGTATHVVAMGQLSRSGNTVTATFSQAGLGAPTLNVPTTVATGELAASTRYCYLLNGFNEQGSTSVSVERCITTGACAAHQCGINLTWSALLGVTGYAISRSSPGPGGETMLVTLPASYTSWTDEGVQRTNGITRPGSDTSASTCLQFAGGTIAQPGGSKVYKSGPVDANNFPGGMKQIQRLVPDGCTLFNPWRDVTCAGYLVNVPSNRCTGFVYTDSVSGTATSRAAAQFTMGEYAVNLFSSATGQSSGSSVRLRMRDNEIAGWRGLLRVYNTSATSCTPPFCNFSNFSFERNRMDVGSGPSYFHPRRNFSASTPAGMVPNYSAGSPELPQNMRLIHISNTPSGTWQNTYSGGIPPTVVIDDKLFPIRAPVTLSGGTAYIAVPHWQDKCACLDLTTPANTCSVADCTLTGFQWNTFTGMQGMCRVTGTGSDTVLPMCE